MSFADIINQEQKKLETQGGNNEKVAYPETKHKRLFFQKNEREILLQVLPSADLYSAFAIPARKIFLSAKSSQGKDINSNFTLDADPNPGSLLEQKITEWQDRGMIPNGFGGQQSAKRVYNVNVVRVIQFNGQWVQERDEQGNLAVRVFEMPQSAYSNVIRKLQDPLYNISGTELSFMDPNKPAPIKVSKPAKGQMEYPVEVYTSVALPPLGQGWENQLEDLQAQVVPTERLENGLQWVQAFIDMKEGRKPQRQDGGNGNGGAPDLNANPFQQPQANPYAQPQGNPYGQQPQQPAQPNTYGQQPQQPNPYAQPQAPQQPVQPNPYAQVQQSQHQQPAQPNPYANIQQPQVPQQPVQPNPAHGLVEDSLPDMGIDNALNNLPPAQPQQPAQPQMPATPPTQSVPNVPQQTAPQQPQGQIQPQASQSGPAHDVNLNGNGLMDIDAMLEKELNGGM
jgi:hypothetical protein